MRTKGRFFIGVAIALGAIVYLIAATIRNTAEYYLTVDEVVARSAELGTKRLRVAGRVKPGSVQWDPSSLTLKFAIVAIPRSSGDGGPVVALADSRPELNVICRGEPKPDMFAEGRDVIVQGKLTGRNQIAATQVLTSCPSKYVPNKDPEG